MSAARIRLWLSQSDHITLEASALRPGWSQPFTELRDLHGLTHRLESGERCWQDSLELELWPFQLSIASAATAPQRICVADWLERAFRLRTELVVFSDFTGEATDGVAITRRLAWRAVITALPPELAADLGMHADNGLPHLLKLHAFEDGTFTDFDSVGTYAAASPARPWTD